MGKGNMVGVRIDKAYLREIVEKSGKPPFEISIELGKNAYYINHLMVPSTNARMSRNAARALCNNLGGDFDRLVIPSTERFAGRPKLEESTPTYMLEVYDQLCEMNAKLDRLYKMVEKLEEAWK